MKRGVIIDLKDNVAVVLTTDGHFVKTRNADSRYQLGQEITFEAAETSRVSSYLRRGLSVLQQLRIGFITAVAIILIFFSLYPVFNSDKVYAYMTIDINPSFELAINGDMEVVKLDPLNEDGEKLLATFPDWSGEGFQSVVQSIISQSQSMGYVKDGKEVLITTIIDRKNDKVFEQNLLSRVQLIKTSLKTSPLTVETAESDMDTRNKAKSEGVSTGTYIRNHPPSGNDKPAAPEQEERTPQEQPEKQDPAKKPEEEPGVPSKEKEDTCADCDQEPQEKDQEPDPDALKEMEKKGKQPPVVPPERDAPPARDERRSGEPHGNAKPDTGSKDEKNRPGKQEDSEDGDHDRAEDREEENREYESEEPKKKEKPSRPNESGRDKENSNRKFEKSYFRLEKGDVNRSLYAEWLRDTERKDSGGITGKSNKTPPPEEDQADLPASNREEDQSELPASEKEESQGELPSSDLEESQGELPSPEKEGDQTESRPSK
ncbi:anti-sigma factor domain-containing protein [Bacillus mangrovi]|uniref:Anti-sigma factor domain-containing protein n=1 Tax=Metabacillus mangrovi TaxID=1491830 RepID=A0A7X2S6C0_9BACI|nr:anti-sigma factor domain-containing protein [Metabacillus mangrovi]MTH54305.1 anti-sigma factor domain-containing protein [Metabacillus mangrovi]